MRLITESRHLQELYKHYFDFTVVNNSIEDTVNTIINHLNDAESKPDWIPSSWFYWQTQSHSQFDHIASKCESSKRSEKQVLINRESSLRSSQQSSAFPERFKFWRSYLFYYNKLLVLLWMNLFPGKSARFTNHLAIPFWKYYWTAACTFS